MYIRLPHNLWGFTENIYEAVSAKWVLSIDPQKKVTFVSLDSRCYHYSTSVKFKP